MLEAILAGVFSLLAGAGSTVFFYSQAKKEKVIENEARQSEEWRKLYEETSEELKEERARHAETLLEKDNKIDSLYQEISRHRDEKAIKSTEMARLEVENTRLCMLKCEVPACPNRKPPTGF